MLFREKLFRKEGITILQKITDLIQCLEEKIAFLFLFIVSFFWFYRRLNRLFLALVFSFAFTALLHWSVALYQKKKRQQKESKEYREKTCKALCRIPKEETIRYVRNAVCEKYALEQIGNELLADQKRNLIQMETVRKPQPVDSDQVFLFHESRGAYLGLLICMNGYTTQAESYAETLSPPLRLINGSDLPFEGLNHNEPEKEKKRVMDIRKWIQPALTTRYLAYGVSLLIGYILYGRLWFLFPALMLLSVSILSKRGKEGPEELFTSHHRS